MSSLSTPTRISRGLIIPGIDTKSPIDNPSCTLSYGGLHTPPQSAHESRRPSLQYTALSDAPYSATSSSFHSQPVTPVHGNGHGRDIFVERWSQSIDAETGTNTNVSVPDSISPTDIQSAHVAFESAPGYHGSIVDARTMYAHMNHPNSMDQFEVQVNSSPPGPESWKQPEQMSSAYGAHNTCLGSTLFPTPHGMNVSTNNPPFIFGHVVPPLHPSNYSYPPSSIGAIQGYGATTTLYQQPQVVVPSQLSPNDNYQEQQFSNYTTPDRSHRLGNSFTSSSMSFDDYDMVGPPSPQDVYFAHSEDEEYLMVKAERFETPEQEFVSQKPVLRQKKRASPRLRKAGNRTPHCHHAVNGFDIRCEGRQCCLQPLNLEIASNKKPFRCAFVEEDGRPCASRFERSEHLRRHEGKHSPERKYPCPLPGCNRRIGRPDNAGDHFKTHLRPKTSGKRNAHFDWNEVHNAIWENYEDQKVAKKLLDGLRRWINQGMPDTSGKRNNLRDR